MMFKIFLILSAVFLITEVNPFSVGAHNSVALSKDNHDNYMKSQNIFILYVNDVK